MADWTDGAAYAPTQRPDGFATPEVEPLGAAPSAPPLTPGAIPPPQAFQPSASQPPLEYISAPLPPRRNPAEPFSTTTAGLASGSVAGIAQSRDPRQPFDGYAMGVGYQELPPPPSGSTGAPPAQPAAHPQAEQWAPPSFPPPGGAPAPGEAPMWGEGTGRNAARPPEDMSAQRTLLVIAIVLTGLGLILPGAAPWLILTSGLVTLRTKFFTSHMGVSATSAGAGLLLFSLAGVPTAGLGFVISIVFLCWASYGLSRARDN